MELKSPNFQNLQIWMYPYFLTRKKSFVNHKQSPQQAGALIKIQNHLGHFGFADLCPWPHLGDLHLEQEIQQQGPLFMRSLQLALEDLQARQNKVQLISPDPVMNNILIANTTQFAQDFSKNKLNYKNKTLKIKSGTDYQTVLGILKSLVLDKAQLNITIRLDFNFSLSADQFAEFLNQLSTQELELVEYIEDPFPFDQKLWLQFNEKVKLALDWSAQSTAWNFRIFKPCRDDMDKVISQSTFALTSSMDHPVGVAHGLRWAQKYPERVHGFATLGLYEPTDFHYFFQYENEVLTYHSDGYGIGFTQLLTRLNWMPLFNHMSQNNFLLSSHRLSEDENTELFLIKSKAEKKFNLKDCFFIPSSGSTQQQDESVKLVVLSRQALENSARRVNARFHVNESSCWGCVLPLFHVGGLGVLIRSQVASCKFTLTEWSDFSLDWLVLNNVTHLSLVPTQLFEIVQQKISAPSCLRYVLIGGASLSEELGREAVKLGWPIVQTFGMSETASMIAVKDNLQSPFFDVMENISIKLVQNKLAIQSNSNAALTIKMNKVTGELKVEEIGEWLITNDEVQIHQNQFKFLQRESDFVKIKGEGVSLFELRNKLGKALMEKNISFSDFTLCDFPDERDGAVLRFVVSKTLHLDAEYMRQFIENFNLSVRPAEKIFSWIEVDDIPVTELKKIKFKEIRMQRNLNVKKI